VPVGDRRLHNKGAGKHSGGGETMAYTELEQLSEGEFKRLCGVSRSTFAEMVGVLHPHMNRQGRRGGQAKLSVEDQ